MRKFSSRRMHRPIVIVLFALLSWCSTHALALPTHELTFGEWSLISLPADPGNDGTIAALFGDDLPADNYGSSGNWVIFSFDSSAGQYRELALEETLKANTGYWMIQLVADSIELDLPDSLLPLDGSAIAGCPTGQLCVSRALTSSGDGVVWNLVGYSSESQSSFGTSRFVSENSACATGCTPSDALGASVANNVLFRFNPNNAESSYELVTEATVMQPWEGYWLATLPSAQALEWVLPMGSDNSDVAPPPPGPSPLDPERDAARLLMQASFGPSESSIEEVLTLGGAAAWVDAQLALPLTLHLPRVKSLSTEDTDNQAIRYQTFWDRVNNASDQLRQRMAFSLSEILVISDKSDALKHNPNMTAAYYDLLLRNSFGNYRDLLEEVTLSPAMGAFLSMLGNDKPNDELGTRADENYAREMMQLFSIGLVELNLDGTEREGINTYEQTDVESLARILTGWSWDVGQWKPNARSGWKPDKTAMERPMAAFADHHDTGEKQFLGVTFPAGQSAEAELQLALDIVFNHPNVGPFISKQLIKRLVTSNPSPGYVARVASTFNDNGNGVRGDLAAVLRAILLDQEARSQEISEEPEFGKLRESILRYAHMFRAFRLTEPMDVRNYLARVVPQIAPMTAPSVFNFFSPNYSPAGAIADANLVAPEFQLNSETNVTTVNNALSRVILRDEFYYRPAVLDISRELQLLSDPEALINHLDLMLTADTLSDASRQLLTEYINTNRDSLNDDERLVEDVISLVITSTEFAIQR